MTYILRTSRGANYTAFDSLEAARRAKAIAEQRHGFTLRIIEQTITEKEITA